MKSKRVVSALLCTVLLAGMAGSITGCNEGGGGESPIGTNSSGQYAETVHFTTVRAAEANPNMPEGMDLTNNPYATRIKDKLNVTYEFLWTDSDYNNKLLLDMTTGNLPDVFMVNDYTMYQQLYASDLIEDLTDVYEEYASDEMKAIYESYGDKIFSPVTENGRLMALPSTANGYQQALLWVRKDWLDALGLDPPKTLDEIAYVARQFVEQDPGGNGPGETIGININREGAFAGYRNSYGLEPVAAALGAYPRQWMQDENGEVYYGSIQPEFKQTLSLVLEWIDAGIIDKDCFEQGWETIWGNVTSGKAGMWFFPWSWPYETQFIINNPRAEVICYPAPLDSNGKATYFTGAPFEGVLCVRKGYEHPEVIFKVFEVYSDMTNGIDAEGYEMLAPVREAGTSWYYIAPLAAYDCRWNDVIPRGAEDMKAWIEDGTEPEIFNDSTKESYQKVKDWLDKGDDPANWSEYMARYVASAVTDGDEWNPVDPCFFFQTKSMTDIWDYLQTMENDMIRTILNGEESIDSFDQFVLDWKAAGGDQITAEVAAEVNGG